MNQKAAALGMRETRFSNAHGLDFGDWASAHYTTAADLAILTRAAWEQPLFRQIVGTGTWQARGVQRSYAMRNANALRWQYPGVDGIKIGYTRRAKQTLIATAVRDSRRLLVVILGSDNRAVDGARLLDTGFSIPAS